MPTRDSVSVSERQRQWMRAGPARTLQIAHCEETSNAMSTVKTSSVSARKGKQVTTATGENNTDWHLTKDIVCGPFKIFKIYNIHHVVFFSQCHKGQSNWVWHWCTSDWGRRITSLRPVRATQWDPVFKKLSKSYMKVVTYNQMKNCFLPGPSSQDNCFLVCLYFLQWLLGDWSSHSTI